MGSVVSIESTNIDESHVNEHPDHDVGDSGDGEEEVGDRGDGEEETSEENGTYNEEANANDQSGAAGIPVDDDTEDEAETTENGSSRNEEAITTEDKEACAILDNYEIFNFDKLNPNHDCDNKNHSEVYLAVGKFIESNISQFCASKGILDIVKALINLTVKITADYICQERENRFPIPAGLRTGTGTIIDLNFPLVHVLTARHVVYNQEEAESIKSIQYFDDKFCEKVIIKGVNSLISDEDDQWDRSIFAGNIQGASDSSIASILRDLEILNSMRKRRKFSRQRPRQCLAITHPHGCFKVISFGESDEDESGHLCYKIPLCQGSSGGVLIDIGARSRLYIVNFSGLNERIYASPWIYQNEKEERTHKKQKQK